MQLESLLQYLDRLLGIPDHPDYRNALNGLQVEGAGRPVRSLCAAVDTSESTIRGAVARGADLLVVHHGLFWSGLRPLTGRHYRKVRALVEAGTALYGAHLPLDSHPELGNCILLARALGLEVEGRFGMYDGAPIGWWGTVAPEAREDFRARVASAVDGPVRVLQGGGGTVEKVAVLTGGGGSFIQEAAAAGMDALVTGEGSHHTYVDAHELGVDVFYGGHYATETFGVKALCAHVAERFGLEWSFVDDPSGL